MGLRAQPLASIPTTLVVVVVVLMSSSLPSNSMAALPRPGCIETCGNVSIPFPFGIGESCYYNRNFNITCNTTFTPPKPFFGNIPVANISLEGQLTVMNYVARACYDRSGNQTAPSRWPSMSLRNFTINSSKNVFRVVGCNSYAYISGEYDRGRKFNTGCIATCGSITDIGNDGACSGAGCCQIKVPPGLRNLTVIPYRFDNNSLTTFSPCSTYAFLAEESAFRFSSDNLTNLIETERLPLVVDWSIRTANTCGEARKDLTTFACKENADCSDKEQGFSDEDKHLMGYRCRCREGYRGNPYVGCTDIDECKEKTYVCKEERSTCLNTKGSYECKCKPGYESDGGNDHGNGCLPIQPKDRHKLYKLVTGISIGILFILASTSWIYIGFRRRKLVLMREKFFRDNGGILLQKQLESHESSKRAKVFTEEELKRATGNFDGSRIIGEGGYGIVYKGYLKDYNNNNNPTVVAIKKSKLIDRTQIESFINEVIVLSQINHRNVVKLLGCCLETETPILVYEFIENGTLSEHIHGGGGGGDCSLSMELRLRIAAETAGVLSYLHSDTSSPIIHRDIKSANILLDTKFTAKVSDFGISRLFAADETQVNTVIQGTIGYLDPEYMQTSELTEKSDVYSFGVLLAELLTCKKVMCFARPEKERSLANHFLSTLKEDRLSEILDGKIANQEDSAILKEVAILVKRCLSIKGEERPTMKEVASELVGLVRMMKNTTSFPEQKKQEDEEMKDLVIEEQSLLCGIEGNNSSITINENGGYDYMSDIIHLHTPDGR